MMASRQNFEPQEQTHDQHVKERIYTTATILIVAALLIDVVTGGFLPLDIWNALRAPF